MRSEVLLTRPSLEYCYVLDACALHASQDDAQPMILTRNAFYRRELHWRLPNVVMHDGSEPLSSFRTLIWAEPALEDLRDFEQIVKAVDVPVRLYVIVPGRLARFLPEQPGPSLSLSQVTRLLHQHGFEINDHLGFHGLTSVFWSYVYRVWRHLNRDDRADRSLQRMRRTYVTGRPYFTTLNLLSAALHGKRIAA